MNGKSAALALPSPGYVYFPRLDGLRAVSIALVLVEHFLWNGVGSAGVTLFFVISGFLITRILVAYRASLPFGQAASVFFGRRALRLFPPYYACIALAALFGIAGVRQTWLINTLYLTNVQVALAGAWNDASHFWTLAIEEQFYLAWFPIVMLAGTAGRLRLAIAICIIGAPVFRGLLSALGTTPFMDILLPGVMDSLAIGALLAVGSGERRAGAAAWCHRMRVPIGLAAFAAYGAVLTFLPGDGMAARVLARSLLGFACAALVSLAAESGHAPGLEWLSARPLRHIGKISYGIYIWHNFIPLVIGPYFWRLELFLPFLAVRLVRCLMLSAVAVAIAEISWRWIERPALSLKDRFSATRDRALHR